MFGRTGPPNFSGPHTRVPRKLPINKSKENVSEHTIPVIEIMHHCMQNRHRNCMTKSEQNTVIRHFICILFISCEQAPPIVFFERGYTFVHPVPISIAADKLQRLGKLNSCVQTVHIYVMPHHPNDVYCNRLDVALTPAKKNGPIDFALMLKWRTGFAGV